MSKRSKNIDVAKDTATTLDAKIDELMGDAPVAEEVVEVVEEPVVELPAEVTRESFSVTVEDAVLLPSDVEPQAEPEIVVEPAVPMRPDTLSEMEAGRAALAKLRAG